MSLSALELPYDCDRARLGPTLAARFRPLARDRELEAWLARWGERPHGFWLTQVSALLSRFLDSYDVHGLLGAYPMHLLSTQGWCDVLDRRRAARMLDVGAGAGYVTEGARAWCDQIECTETAPRLRSRLVARGFVASALDLSQGSLGRSFDLVSCFNVLDRTDRPLSLLRSLVAHTAAGGRLLLSIPLPPAPHVHVRGGTRAPRERLPSLAGEWEDAARELSERLIAPTGLTIERLARLPYLSRGDTRAPLYVLDAALWVCTPQ